MIKKLKTGVYPSQKVCATMEGISKSLISKWVKGYYHLSRVQTSRNKNNFRVKVISMTKYAKESDDLYEAFVYIRKSQGRKVDQRWLKTKMMELVSKSSCYGSSMRFVASNGWLDRWKKTYRVSSQMRTEKKPVSNAGYETIVVPFWKAVLELQRSEGKYENRDPAYGRFAPKQVWNVDQVPVGFVPNRRTSLNPKGEPCWIPSLGSSGLGKRLGTLILCLRAGDPQIVPPMVVFRGQGSIKPAYLKELDEVGIPYRFQANAWADGSICLDHLKYMYEKIRGECKDGHREENLLILDGLASQGTDRFMREALSRDIYPYYLPPNTTHMLQPIDHHIGAEIKREIAALYEAHSSRLREVWMLSKTNKSLSAQRVRVFMLQWVKIAWEKIVAKPGFILKSFTSTGVLIPMSGAHQIVHEGYKQVKLV